MCGIVGYVGHRPATELLLGGLERLEYRGYDSAGIATVAPDGETHSVRAVGNLAHLRAEVAELVPVGARFPADGWLVAKLGNAGIGHTRWATHGAVEERNAHPHPDTYERVYVVLNGIVENHAALRRELEADGALFRSDTDAEVVSHLVGRAYERDLEAAVAAARERLEGHFAFVALAAERPDVLVATRRDCPLVIGAGEGETFLASSAAAFLAHTNRVQELRDEEIAVATVDGTYLRGRRGTRFSREPVEVDWTLEAAEKGGYDTYMRKEIDEQPDALARTLAAHFDGDELALDVPELRGAARVRIVACGTSYHAGLCARYAIERWARLPVEVEVASEYRYREPVVEQGELVVGITQSGETADTLAAMRLARANGATVAALTNVVGSQVTREAAATLYTHAGIEIGVAATKTFVCQVAALSLLGLALARERATLPPARLRELAAALRDLPAVVRDTIADTEAAMLALADRFRATDYCMFLGRHAGLPVAMEGALKLKEISYIPSDPYPAGEMKHGPIALLSPGTPVVSVATASPVLDKLMSNLAEVRARGAHVIAIATEGSADVADHADDVLWLRPTDEELQPLLASVPLQLLAYHVARVRGLNVDQPRNLAKTVTVE